VVVLDRTGSTTPYLDSSVKKRHFPVPPLNEVPDPDSARGGDETAIDESDCIRIFGLVEREARAMMKIRAWGANRLARPEEGQGVVRLDPTPV
jgi:hypothetical protein